MVKPLPTVHTLLCSSHVSFGLPCLQSFQRQSKQSFHLLIHDDGTLSIDDIEQLSQIPSASVLTSAEADDSTAGFQEKYPSLYAARTFLPHVRKLLDINICPTTDEITRFVDSDVFFFHRFDGLFPDSVEQHNQAVFSVDSNSSFGCRVSDFKPLGPVRLRAKLNSGLFWINRSAVDFDRFEYLCHRWGPERIRTYGGWFEQMLWSDCAYRIGARMFDMVQIATGSADFIRSERNLAVHYVTPSRHLLQQVLNNSPTNLTQTANSDTPTMIRTTPGQTFGLLAALKSAISFKFEMLRKQWRVTPAA